MISIRFTDNSEGFGLLNASVKKKALHTSQQSKKYLRKLPWIKISLLLQFIHV